MSSPRSLHCCGLTFILCALAFLAVLIAPRPSRAQPVPLPQPALLPSANPLCDSNLVPCLDIDEFAAHAYAHLMVLPHSAQRDSAAVIPYGISIGLLGRIAGGISTHYAFWQEGDTSLHRYGQHGPLRLSLSTLLWPLLPLRQAPRSEQHEDGESHFVPPRHLRIGLVYEHELRVGPFDGANQLGMLADLAALRLVATRTFGPIEITASAGALYDWRGMFATGEGAVQLGVYLPFFKALKLYGEALGRGGTAYIREGVTLPARDPEPLRAQGVLGLGLSFRPHARVDLGVSVQRGLGGLAPSAVIARFAVLSVGKTYQGRAASPMAQMAADAATEFAGWVAQNFQAIDPYLMHNCVLYDDNHKPVVKLGALGPDGESCIYQGMRIPIGPHFWWNKGQTRLCNDKAMNDCFLTRTDRSAEWEPSHPLLVHGDCFAYHNGRPWMRIGQRMPGDQGCENQGHIVPVGQALKPSPKHPGYYCYDEPDKARNQTEKQWCLERPTTPQTDLQYFGRRWAEGIDKSGDDLKKKDESVRQVIDEMAEGTPLHATTPVREAEATGHKIFQTAQNATLDDGKRIARGILDSTRDWLSKPLREQAGDVAAAAGDAMTSPTTYAAGAGVLFNRGGKVLAAADKIDDLGYASKKGKKLGKAAKRAGEAEEEAVQKAPAWAPKLGYHPAPSIPEGFPDLKLAKRKTTVQGGGHLRKRWVDGKQNIYEWDSQHGTLEMYDRRGRHLGEFDPKTRDKLKEADSTRRVDP